MAAPDPVPRIRQRPHRNRIGGARLGERPAVPRISDLGHLYSSSLGKLELDLMGSHQMTERQVLDAILAEAVRDGQVIEPVAIQIGHHAQQGRPGRGAQQAGDHGLLEALASP